MYKSEVGTRDSAPRNHRLCSLVEYGLHSSFDKHARAHEHDLDHKNRIKLIGAPTQSACRDYKDCKSKLFTNTLPPSD